VALHLSPGHLRAEMNKTASGAGNGTKTAHELIIETSRDARVAHVVEVADAGGDAPVAQLDFLNPGQPHEFSHACTSPS